MVERAGIVTGPVVPATASPREPSKTAVELEEPGGTEPVNGFSALPADVVEFLGDSPLRRAIFRDIHASQESNAHWYTSRKGGGEIRGGTLNCSHRKRKVPFMAIHVTPRVLGLRLCLYGVPNRSSASRHYTYEIVNEAPISPAVLEKITETRLAIEQHYGCGADGSGA